jgi:hypothetical protein
VLPSLPFTSLYLFTLSSLSALDSLPPETTSHLPEPHFLSNHESSVPKKSTLELSREELLAAGYEKKKQVWSSR